MELTSKSSEIANEPNRERSPRITPRPFEDGSYRAAERFCNARKRPSARFLKLYTLGRALQQVGAPAFIAKLLLCVWWPTEA
jgi:hypothetical protein